MAIGNVTPDSFYAASRLDSVSNVLTWARGAVSDGADILDIGGCSTRPGSTPASEEDEWARVEPALTVLRETMPDVPLSLDTFRPEIARRAVEEFGVELINDISGGKTYVRVEGKSSHSAGYVLTYNRANDEHKTDNLLADAVGFLTRRVDELHQAGVSDVIIDPGFGFGQTAQESLSLLTNLRALQHIGCPILVGISRKRMAYEPAGLTPDTCLEQTLALEQQAILQGANILRVHDVAATRQMINGK